jgi:hypothetical protein
MVDVGIADVAVVLDLVEVAVAGFDLVAAAVVAAVVVPYFG